MPTAMEGAYARYGHIVNPSIWSRFLDLCLGRGLADRLLYARLERAHTESVTALLESGETVYPLPSRNQSQSSHGRLFGDARPTTIDSGTVQDSTSQRDREQNEQGEQTEQEGGEGRQEEGEQDQSCFQPFFWDRLGGEYPPVDRILFNDMLPPEARDREVDYSTWFTFEWSRRRRPDPSIYTQKSITHWGTYNGYGFQNAPNPNISNMSRMFMDPEAYLTERFSQGCVGPGMVAVADPARMLEGPSAGQEQAADLGQGGDSGCVIMTDSGYNNGPGEGLGK